MSIVSTISVFILSNPIATNLLLSEDYFLKHSGEPLTGRRDWREWARVASLQRDSNRPWHVFELRWQKFCEDAPFILLHALDCVGREYLCVRNRRLFIKEHELFARWQNLRGRMSMRPIKFRLLYKEGLHLRSSLVHPHSSCMADYIQREGLNECHLHLHACMPPELSWLLALNRLSEYERGIAKSDCWKLRLLYTAVHPELTVEKMMMRMRLARYLRDSLLGVQDVGDIKPAVNNMYRQYQNLVQQSVVEPGAGCFELRTDDLALLENQEQLLWGNLFALADRNVPNVDALLFFAHLYLLIQNDYLQLCRMNEANKGFDAFQVRAHYAELGYPLQVYYRRAFQQILESSSVTEGTCIEVRVSPVVFLKGGKFLEEIWRSCCTENNGVTPQLILTVHFLKRLHRNAKPFDSDVMVERYAASRRALRKECCRLIGAVKSLSQRCDIGMSIDGAGNEMHMPPDVMAPVFRLFERETGISYKTYHCGEDFYHLISGIRAVYEGVLFLDLKQGNRVGHATSIGIPPQLWRADMPGVLVMRQGDWLLDLIFTWKILSDSCYEGILKIEQMLLPLAKKIFDRDKSEVDMHSLSAFFDARQLNLESIEMARGIRKNLSPCPEEQLAIEFRKERGECGLQLFDCWLYDALSIQEQNELIEVERDFLDTETLLLLQQKVQRLINKRNVVLEALPVSNVRISQYQDMRQHHILRWLGVPGHVLPGDQVMAVCIGSDDPGIFVSDIKNEFYHVFANLRGEGLQPDDCMKYIKRLNHAGRVYSFREKIIKDENYEFADWPTEKEVLKRDAEDGFSGVSEWL